MLVLMEYCWIYVIFIGKKTQNRVRCWVKTPTPQSTKKKKQIATILESVFPSWQCGGGFMCTITSNTYILLFSSTTICATFFVHIWLVILRCFLYLRVLFNTHFWCFWRATFDPVILGDARAITILSISAFSAHIYIYWLGVYTLAFLRTTHSHTHDVMDARALTRVGGVFGLKNP